MYNTLIPILTAFIATYYVLVMGLSAVYVILSKQLLMVVFDLGLSSEYSQCRILDHCTIINSTLCSST